MFEKVQKTSQTMFEVKPCAHNCKMCGSQNTVS